MIGGECEVSARASMPAFLLNASTALATKSSLRADLLDPVKAVASSLISFFLRAITRAEDPKSKKEACEIITKEIPYK